MEITISPVATIPFASWKVMWLAYLGQQAEVFNPAQHELTYQRMVNPSFNLFGLVACESSPIGLAHYYFHPSTFHSMEDCCLQDLYVGPSARGRGLGQALVQAVAAEARGRGAPVVHWRTRATNSAALALYSKFAQRTEFVSFRLGL